MCDGKATMSAPPAAEDPRQPGRGGLAAAAHERSGFGQVTEQVDGLAVSDRDGSGVVHTAKALRSEQVFPPEWPVAVVGGALSVGSVAVV